MIKKFHTKLTVDSEGNVIAHLPIDLASGAIPPGEHEATILIEVDKQQQTARSQFKLHTSKWSEESKNKTYSREEIYGEEGR
ncbi:MAG: hypothetical protein SFU25_00040 [Candidatus Caenarcaniphilales bacterium]|nr:hypothetical protein [Candidatus Caenarcaniphilales bacterium]